MLQSGDSVYIPELPRTAMSEKDYELLLNSSVSPDVFPVRLIGEFKKPGVYDVRGQSPYLNSAIAEAGGFKQGATKKKIIIRRFTSKDTYKTMIVNPKESDVMLRPNDIIYVAERKLYKAGNFFEQINRILSPFTNTALTAGLVAAP